MAHTPDETDRQIIFLLQRDGRLSNVEIGRQLGLAEGTVRKRLERLIGENVIRIIALAEPAAFGLTTRVLISIQAELGELNNVAQRLAQMPEVCSVSVITGSFDIIIEVALPSSDRLLSFLIDKVSSIPGVKRTETSQVMQVVKHRCDWSVGSAGEGGSSLTPAQPPGDQIMPGAIVISS